MTALMCACQQGKAEVVKILLAHGADTQIKDNEDQNVFDLVESQEIKDLLQGDLLAFLSSLSSSSETDPILNEKPHHQSSNRTRVQEALMILILRKSSLLLQDILLLPMSSLIKDPFHF